MKECFKCGAIKPLTEYYKHKAMADGHLNKCKSCKKLDAKNYRLNNLENVRAYDRQRHINDPDRRKKVWLLQNFGEKKTKAYTLREQENGARETQKNMPRIPLRTML